MLGGPGRNRTFITRLKAACSTVELRARPNYPTTPPRRNGGEAPFARADGSSNGASRGCPMMDDPTILHNWPEDIEQGSHPGLACLGHLEHRYGQTIQPHGEDYWEEWYECSRCGTKYGPEEVEQMAQAEEEQECR